jgi:hypothetical protein
MLTAGFKPMTSVFELEKPVRALDSEASAIGSSLYNIQKTNECSYDIIKMFLLSILKSITG